jgi:Zn-dependent protease
MLAVSLAGPLTNLILASIGAVALGMVVSARSSQLVPFVFTWILVNVFIGIFNLAPFPPLDGSEVVAWLLPRRAREVFYAIRGYGFLLLFALIFAFPGLLFRIVDPIVGAIIGLLAGG